MARIQSILSLTIEANLESVEKSNSPLTNKSSKSRVIKKHEITESESCSHCARNDRFALQESSRALVFMEWSTFISQLGINYGIYLRASIFVSEAKRKTPLNLCLALPVPVRVHIRATN